MAETFPNKQLSDIVCKTEEVYVHFLENRSILLVTSLKVASANVGKLSLNIPQILRFRVSTEPEFLCAWYSHCFPSVGPYSDALMISFLDERVGRVQKFLCDFCYCGFQWGKM